MERFFATLNAPWVQRPTFPSTEQARACMFAYLAVFSNRQRRHSSFGSRSPLAFAQLPVGP
jgi:putative transposase